MDIDLINLSEPVQGERDQAFVSAVLDSGHWHDGPMTEAFEQAFARWVGRKHAVSVASGTLGVWVALRAWGIGAGDEVVCPAHAWHQVAQAVTLCGATPVFADINYWSGCLSPEKAALKITPRTRALLAGNTNGHPAAWGALRTLATQHGLHLLEDSTESLGSTYLGRNVGQFGDVAVFDFSQPGALCTGEGGMLVTDDDTLVHELRYLRQRRLADRKSVSVGARVPLQAGISELTAALGLSQLSELDDRLAQRQQVVGWYQQHMQSFEGIKPPYRGEDVQSIHWMLYVVHLGKRFSGSARTQIIDDLAACGIEAVAYSQPLHRQFAYVQAGAARGVLADTDRIADRALALPLHTQLDEEQVQYIVTSLQDAATNVGAGAAIY